MHHSGWQGNLLQRSRVIIASPESARIEQIDRRVDGIGGGDLDYWRARIGLTMKDRVTADANDKQGSGHKPGQYAGASRSKM